MQSTNIPKPLLSICVSSKILGKFSPLIFLEKPLLNCIANICTNRVLDADILALLILEVRQLHMKELHFEGKSHTEKASVPAHGCGHCLPEALQ